MATLFDRTISVQPGPIAEGKTASPTTLWQKLALGGIMTISLFMNFFQLGQNGFGNLYYAAGIRSMLDSWHTFFFVSFDPGGFVTLDKPPLGFWLQALSAKIFGFTPFSIYLPQALAGVLSVALLYHLVRRHFGVWLIPLIVISCISGALVLIVIRIIQPIEFSRNQRYFSTCMLSIAILGLMIVPTIWTAIPVIQNVQAQLPVAGPTQQGDFGNPGGPKAGASADTTLISYLEAHQGNTMFLVATPSSMTADEIILATNKPIMALGGFSGGDPILTTSQLETQIHQGTVRYFLLNSFGARPQPSPQSPNNISEQHRQHPGGGGGFNGGPQNSLTSWVMQHCTTVSTSQLQSSSTTNQTSGPSGASQLYDCAKQSDRA